MPLITKEVLDSFSTFCKGVGLPSHIEDEHFNWTLLNIYAEKEINGTAFTGTDNIDAILEDFKEQVKELRDILSGNSNTAPCLIGPLKKGLIDFLKEQTVRLRKPGGSALFLRLRNTMELVSRSDNTEEDTFTLEELDQIIAKLEELEILEKKLIGRVSTRETSIGAIKRPTYKEDLKPLIAACVGSMEEYKKIGKTEQYSIIFLFLHFAGFLDFMSAKEIDNYSPSDLSYTFNKLRHDFIKNYLE